MSKPWFRVYPEILMHPKFIPLAIEDVGWWVCLAAVAAFCDRAGALRPLSDVAAMLRRPPSDVRAAVERLVSEGLIDRVAGGARDDGNVTFHMHDWEDWQYVSDSSTNRVRKHREAQRNVSPNVSETPSTEQSSPVKLSTDSERFTPDVVNLAFERFRTAYPKRDGDQNWSTAKTRFAAAIKKGVDPETIILGASRYRDAMERAGNTGERAKFVKQAATWLNQRTWEEYAPPAAAKPATVAEPSLPLAEQPWPPPGISFVTMVASARHCGGGIGGWPRAKWGPAPGEAGCRIPDQYLTDEDRRRTWREWDEVIADVRVRREMTSGVM